jgi:predicted phosphodiesterase
MFWLEGDKLELKKGEKLILCYRVVVHSGDTTAAQVREIFKQYEQAVRGSADKY